MALHSKMSSKDPELEEPAQQLFWQRGKPDTNRPGVLAPGGIATRGSRSRGLSRYALAL